MSEFHATLSHYANVEIDSSTVYPSELLEIASLEKSRIAVAEISRWPGYKPTPLYQLESLARSIGVNKIFYKDESQRFNLQSFKALGGAYAVARQLQARIYQRCGENATIDELLGDRYQSIIEAEVIS